MTRLSLYIAVFFSEILFWFKKRAGFMDLGTPVVVTGTVAAFEAGISQDGDLNFDLALDPEFVKFATLITTHPSEASLNGIIHCEVMPKARLRRAFPALTVGMRVRVSGRWAFDGSHSDASVAGQRPQALELAAAVVGRAPNPNGWPELHPVDRVDVL